MIGYELLNNNEMCYSTQTQTFSPTKYPLNRAYLGTHAKALFKSPFQKNLEKNLDNLEY